MPPGFPWLQPAIALGIAACLGRAVLDLALPVPLQRWVSPTGLVFVRAPAGSFERGSEAPGADADERPRHRVTLSRSFGLAVTEVTRAQWARVMGGPPGDDLPAQGVSWREAQVFLQRLNAREGTTRYRLPTEAEWEYACRQGLPEGRGADLAPWGWWDPHSQGRAHPVATRQANALGLHDTLGNVYEWCQDWKGPYPADCVTDPRGPAQGEARVARGGSWFVHANRSRPIFRDAFDPGHAFKDMGLRVAMDLP